MEASPSVPREAALAPVSPVGSAACTARAGQIMVATDAPAKARLVLAWIEIHRDDLLADWELAVSGQQPHKIEPLR
jgi:hypothetical protein